MRKRRILPPLLRFATKTRLLPCWIPTAIFSRPLPQPHAKSGVTAGPAGSKRRMSPPKVETSSSRLGVNVIPVGRAKKGNRLGGMNTVRCQPEWSLAVAEHGGRPLRHHQEVARGERPRGEVHDLRVLEHVGGNLGVDDHRVAVAARSRPTLGNAPDPGRRAN